ncbi:MAG TPA: NAD(P)(+) transhydrogenase (Re/Si-specific) subunit beta [Saprospiraceae bacterium]|nr:NAD(P)(+) transhydrogenase (Re/Si-specific) subunit beta [Saprospiraceae bacterium]
MEVYYQLAYLAGAICFILGLRGLSDPKTARRGNIIAAIGMGIAVVASLFYPLGNVPNNFIWIAGAVAVGSTVGWMSASKVQMTAMPQLISIFNGLGGGSAMLLALIEFIGIDHVMSEKSLLPLIILFTIFVGSISFSGSILAYLKLDGKVNDKQVVVKGHQYLNIFLMIVSIVFLVYTFIVPSTWAIAICVVLCLIYGFSFVAPIGGADMPVVISLLNSVTGISAAAAGFLYNNQIMILGGILVGAAGTILTILMCEAMNRSLLNVIIGGFTATGSAASDHGDQNVTSLTPMDAAILLNYSSKVMMVPGYGMAVAQAQKQAKELDEFLGRNGVEVVYGIHPVAGRMPGHMNVLLAEVDISYDKLCDLDESNSHLSDTDVVLVVGANDVVNPSAKDDPGSSIYGMPVIEVWRAKQVIVFKRSMNPGYAGIQNPLFFKDNTKMLFGDATDSLKKIIDEIKTL